MTFSTQENLQIKIDILESLQAWFENHIKQTSNYGSVEMPGSKSFDEIIEKLTTQKMTLDSLFAIDSLSFANHSAINLIVCGICEELNIQNEDSKNLMTPIFTHIRQRQSTLDDTIISLVNNLFETQIKAYTATLQMLKRVQATIPSRFDTIQNEVKPSQQKSSSCFKRYFCCCFNFYKSNKYQGTSKTAGETTSLLQKACQTYDDSVTL